MRVKDLVGKRIECTCGKVHEIPRIDILPVRAEEVVSSSTNALFLVDENTASLVEVPRERCLLLDGSERVLATMENVEKTMEKLRDYEEIVSIGSGTLTDIARYAAFLAGKDFSCVPTAPSVDAYTSTVAPILVHGVKKTFKAKPPRRIFLDMEILKNAPFDLLRAGVGDIAAKVIARMDWVLSNAFTGEYLCDFVWEDLKDVLKEVFKSTSNVLKREEKAVEVLTEGLLVSGLNMTIVGNSRPASGAEHMVSHMVEMYYEEKGKFPPFHGLTVAVGTFVVMKAYELIVNGIELPKEDFSLAERERELKEMFEEEKVREFLKTYKEKKIPKVDLNKARKMILNVYEEYFPLLEDALEEIGVRDLIEDLGRELLAKIVRLSNTIRDRFTVLDILDSERTLKSFSEWVIQQV